MIKTTMKANPHAFGKELKSQALRDSLLKPRFKKVIAPDIMKLMHKDIRAEKTTRYILRGNIFILFEISALRALHSLGQVGQRQHRQRGRSRDS